MQINNLFIDDEAVSPVIGVILMVAITVILAAVIGAFVLGIGGSQTQTPQASWEWTEPSSAPSSGVECKDTTSPSSFLVVTHQGGDQINDKELSLGGNDCDTDTDITAGDKLYIDDPSSGTNSLVWKSPSSDDTSILSSYEV